MDVRISPFSQLLQGNLESRSPKIVRRIEQKTINFMEINHDDLPIIIQNNPNGKQYKLESAPNKGLVLHKKV